MAADEIHVGDKGTRITVVFYDGSTVVDVSGASTKEIIFLAPDGDHSHCAATYTTDGTDGSIYYDTVAATFDEDGDWALQGHVVIGDSEWHSDVHRFTVYPNID